MKTAAHQYEDKLLELAYGELPAHEASAVESHVKGCTRCTEALTEIRAVRSTMAKLPMLDPPSAGLDSLLAYADQAARRNEAERGATPAWFRRFLGPIVALGTVCVVGVIAVRALHEPGGGDFPNREQAALETKRQPPAESVTAAATPAAPAPVAVDAPTGAVAPVVNAAPAGEDNEKEERKAEKKPARIAEGAKGKYKQAVNKDVLERQEEASELQANLLKVKEKELDRAKNAEDEKSADDGVAYGGRGSVDAVPGNYRDARQAPPMKVAKAEEPAPSYGLQQAGGGGTRGAPAPDMAQAPANAPPPPPLAEPSSKAGLAYQNRSAPQRTVGSYNSKSDSLSLGASSGATLREEEDERGPAQAQQKTISKRDDSSNRRLVTDLETLLTQARQASNAADSETEARISLQVLNRGAQGSQRVEALSRACNALQALQRVDDAARYCQQLVNEFPDSPAARRYSERQTKHASPAASRSKKAYDSDQAVDRQEAPTATPPSKAATEQNAY